MHNLHQIDELKNIVFELLSTATKLGASAAEAGIGIESGLSVTGRLGEAETIEHHRSQSLGITVYRGNHKGSASTTNLLPASIKEAVSAACNIAKLAGADSYAGLPEADMLAKNFLELDLYHPWQLNTEQAIALALNCEDAARSFHSAINNSEGATVNTHEDISILGNTLGFLGSVQSTQHSLSCSVLGQKDESMQRNYWYSVARSADELEEASAIGKRAAQRTVARLGSVTLSTRRCPIIFAAEVASGLIGHLVSAISGGNLYRKSSFLLNALATKIFPDFIHIHEQPHLVKAMGSANYDSEGVGTQTRDIVLNGVLSGYVLSSYSARKLNLQTTGNAGGVHNLTVDSGTDNLDGLLQKMGTGLLVTEVLGQGVNIITGDYSRGVAGFWVENGTISYPVAEITIAGNLVDMFQQIIAVGNDMDKRGNIRCGSIMLEQMTVAGN